MHLRLDSLEAELTNGDSRASDLLRECSPKELQGSE